ncbi:MAG: glycosyltransferase family 2 protein [Candidatus Hydrogenedentales bacterium]|jgi:glycosyltransferase involved in cell wall biosynthesis
MSGQSQPSFSVIIPTRERADTLKYAIATALNQDFDAFEVIVSDNCSLDDTREVVLEFNDPRVKYFNTGRRLSMCDNYEFALEHATGKYVTIIGDDDAVMPGALRRLNAEMEAHPSSIYAWPKGVYVWPFGERKATVERIPHISPRREINLEKSVRRCVSQGAWGYTRIPNVYHSMVKAQILSEIRTTTGRVFHSTQPDLFTGFALPVFSNTALNVGYPVTLHGRSPKSNGGVAVDKGALENISLYLREFGDYQVHPTLPVEFPHLAPHANFLPDSLLVAIELFPEYYERMKFNYEAMWTLFCLNTDKGFRFGIRTRDILLNTPKIRRYHSFSTLRFLLHLAAYKVFLSSRELLKRPPELGPFQSDAPNNILDFVKQLDEWQASQRTS